MGQTAQLSDFSHQHIIVNKSLLRFPSCATPPRLHSAHDPMVTSCNFKRWRWGGSDHLPSTPIFNAWLNGTEILTHTKTSKQCEISNKQTQRTRLFLRLRDFKITHFTFDAVGDICWIRTSSWMGKGSGLIWELPSTWIPKWLSHTYYWWKKSCSTWKCQKTIDIMGSTTLPPNYQFAPARRPGPDPTPVFQVREGTY